MDLCRPIMLRLLLKKASQLIVAQAVTQEANDKKQIIPMVEAIEDQAGQMPEQLLADSGYCSERESGVSGEKAGGCLYSDRKTETRAKA